MAEPAGERLLRAGADALGEGDWRTARARFEEALEHGETPAALEGLSWAAWWLDDAEVVFRARERAYELHRAAGDVAGAARMAIWLGSDHFDFHGAAAVANGWLQRARRLLDALEPGPEHGWLAMHEGYLAHVQGDHDRSLPLGARAAELGRRFGVPDLEMLGLALEGSALVARAQVDAGMHVLDEATALALEGDAEIPISSAWSCCFMVSACTAVGDYERAVAWCDRIAEFADRHGSRYMLAFCRAEYGVVHLWRGRWTDAEAVLEAAIEDFGRSRPAMIGAPVATLAELRRRQGRAGEALELLDRAPTALAAQLCRARLALDRGEPREAVELAERLLRRLPPEARGAHARALEVLARARIADRDLDGAAAALRRLRDIDRLIGTAPVRAAGDLVAGVLEAARGDHERARPRLEDAADVFERCGAPFESAQARLELAASLAALGRAGPARREATQALDHLRALGAGPEAERARALLEASGGEGAGRTPAAEVRPREREVLALLAEGLTNRQIAERLVVSEHTVHRHVTNILRRLELPSRAAAAAYAVRSGLLDGDR